MQAEASEQFVHIVCLGISLLLGGLALALLALVAA